MYVCMYISNIYPNIHCGWISVSEDRTCTTNSFTQLTHIADTLYLRYKGISILYSILILFLICQISDVKYVLDQFLRQSVIGFHSSDDDKRGNRRETTDETRPLVDGETTDETRPLVESEEGGGKYFRLCTIKDRYCAAAEWSCDGG